MSMPRTATRVGKEAVVIDYEIQRCTRHCAASGRELVEGETFYSVLLQRGASLERVDYSAEAWNGPPPDALGW